MRGVGNPTSAAQGVIPADPDAWIWAGDFVYLDNAFLDCAEVPTQPDCTCNATWLSSPPFMCMAGNLPHAVQRWNMMVRRILLRVSSGFS